MEHKKEYDLLDLIKWGVELFNRYVFSPILFLVRFALKKWYFMLLAVLIGLGVAILLPEYFNPVYSGNMLVKVRVGQSSDYISTLQSLSKESGDVIMKNLKVPANAIVSYRGLFPSYVYPTDTLNTGYKVELKNKTSQKEGIPVVSDIFAVEVRSKDSSTIRLWGDAIVNYFKNDPYVHKENQMRLSGLRHNIEVIQNEIAKLDSLRNIEYFENSRKSIPINENSSAMSMLFRKQPQLIYKDIIELNEKMLGYQNILDYSSEPIEVISPMALNATPPTHWRLTYKKYVFVSVLLMYCLLLVFTYRKEIVAFIKK